MRTRRFSPVNACTCLALAMLLAAASGCCIFRRGRVPMPPPLGREAVVVELRGKAARFQTLTDTDITLRSEFDTQKGTERQPTLGGVIAFDARLPALWLRGEKVSREVFDLRATAEGFSLKLPHTGEIVVGTGPAYRKLPLVIAPREVLGWFGPPQSMGLDQRETAMSVEETDYRFDVRAGETLLRTVFVDRWQAAVRKIVEWDPFNPGQKLAEIELGEFKPIGDREFPHRIVIYRPQHDYRMTLELSHPKLNKDLPLKMFAPHKAPPDEWRLIDLDKEPLSSVKAFSGEE